SYFEETDAIISMAQHANPKVIGHNADFLAQFTTKSKLVVIILGSRCRSSILMVKISRISECIQTSSQLQSAGLAAKGGIVLSNPWFFLADCRTFSFPI